MGFFANGSDERVENFFYSLLHHSFGLPSRYALDAGHSRNLRERQSPLSVQWSNFQVKAFSITGPELIPLFFMNSDSYCIYNRIDRNLTFPARMRMAYDFSRIQEGTLSGIWAVEGSPELQASDECRKLLNIIHHSGVNQWRAIPLVYAETGPIYAATGIPDRIYLQLPTAREASQEFRQNIIRNIYNTYQMSSFPDIDVELQQDQATSTMNFQASVKVPEPQFPYDYYYSIGLIDDEGMVTAPSFLGPVRFPANSEQGREHLLKAGQENTSQ